MSTRLELDDLPPRYREQARAQLESRAKEKRRDEVKKEARTAGKVGRSFESRGEYEYFMREVLPRLQSGEILRATPHVHIPLLQEKQYCGLRLPAARYTADYVLLYADSHVEVVEIKCKFTRRMQRDYIYRRRLFIDLVAEPRGWRFTEIITDDTKDEVKQWRELAKGAVR